MIKSINASNLGMMLRCGEQFRRRYIEGERIPPGIALGRGIGVHESNRVNLRQKIQTKQDLPLSDLQDAARDAYVKTFENGVYVPKDELASKDRLLNDGLNDTIRCTTVYREEVAPGIHPIATEEKFSIDIGLELPLNGFMDYQEEPTVGELKSSAKKWPEYRVQNEIQFPFYSFVHEKQKGIRPEVIYHILIARRNKDGKATSTDYQQLQAKATDAHYRAMFAWIKVFCAMLKAGVFPPAERGSWMCDPKWCGYYETCPYVGNCLPIKWA